MLEILLTRIFDVILAPNISYMIITNALFAIGGAGVYGSLFPSGESERARSLIALYAIVAAIAIVAILPMTWASWFDPSQLFKSPLRQLAAFFLLYITVLLPFFFLGLIFVSIFSAASAHVQTIYFWDLLGAGIGCIVFLPFLGSIAPGGLLVCAAGLMMAVAALFTPFKVVRLGAPVVGLLLLAYPFTLLPKYLEFKMLWDKRAVAEDVEEGLREFSRWDKVAKIDVIDIGTSDHPDYAHPDADGKRIEACCYKHVAYDGGNQSSRLIKLTGTPAELRARLEAGDGDINANFWFGGVLASHYLKRDRNSDVLILGSAGGQEVKAALMYGAGHIDAVEMVGTVIELAKHTYSDYIGRIFEDPRVTTIESEGRSYLRSTDHKYDIIQIFSNHTSSAAAAGGMLGTIYLQTAEAYEEYFSHLKNDGILHINHHFYPRMVATAALAWKRMGFGSDFQDHVVVLERARHAIEMLPTMLIKMSPWTDAELEDLQNEQNALPGGEPVVMVVDPRNRAASFLSRDFFTGEFPKELDARMIYDSSPTTDDRPYFGQIRRNLAVLSPDPATFLNRSIANYLNKAMPGGVPLDLIHLIVTGIGGIFFAVTFVLIPMMFSQVGRARWPYKKAFIVYFSCLGFGFILFELVFIQIFMLLIGFPLYTYSTVIFSMLAAAGLGSLFSARLGITPGRRWEWPFLGALITAVALLYFHPMVFELGLALPLAGRIVLAMLLVFPLAFCLGMPFPLGILALLDKPAGAVAWAWALNAVFTVLGGYLSIVISMKFGFRITLWIGVGAYVMAFLAFFALRQGYGRAATLARMSPQGVAGD